VASERKQPEVGPGPTNAAKTGHESVLACTRSIAADSDIELPEGAPLACGAVRSAARGFYDSLALKRSHHNRAVHTAHQPVKALSRSIFGAIERERYEALGANAFAGIRHNIDRYKRLTEPEMTADESSDISSEQMLQWVRQECRSAFRQIENDPATEVQPVQIPFTKLRESRRLWLNRMADVLEDQEAFAKLAQRWSDHVSQYVSEETRFESGELEDLAVTEVDDVPDDENDSTVNESFGEAEKNEQEADQADQESQSKSDVDETLPEQTLDEAPVKGPDPTIQISGVVQPYTVFTTDFDVVAHASQCADAEKLAKWRNDLDKHIAVHGRLVRRLASRLQRVLLAQQKRQWQFDLESELAFRDTTVTLLIDNSRSMLGRPIMIAATCVDILARTLERCGVTVEILGFTTCHLQGGQSTEVWEQKGRPANPGRLNDLRHIIYKSADTPYHQARKNLGLMLDRDILKQNIDGEALTWAYGRLLKRPEQRRILMTISDGAPVDTSTLGANSGDYLAQHLQTVIDDIERAAQIELLAIGIGHDVSRFYSHAVSVFDSKQLGPVMLEKFAALFRQAV